MGDHRRDHQILPVRMGRSNVFGIMAESFDDELDDTPHGFGFWRRKGRGDEINGTTDVVLGYGTETNAGEGGLD